MGGLGESAGTGGAMESGNDVAGTEGELQEHPDQNSGAGTPKTAQESTAEGSGEKSAMSRNS